ncbi:hypothetical protein NX801_26365 [Streptomyces sp. LP05-1]|uniref:ABC transporter permease n=1 Tax=Streptomyces pyxinae TaxID=2970734 RepID=A0ABT2CNU5_9ACTN|nr:hypothetical protein [Streptomyces sp. LP05-1]MCS0639104.1 hypothetical protein [Streptomyces sp. LP05-1]
MRYEIRHLAGLRSTWILLTAIGVLSLVAGLTAPLGAQAGKAPSVWTMVTAFQMDAVSLQLPLSALLLLPVATGPVATELLRGTARTTWLTVAGRRMSFAAKLLVGGALGALIALGGAALVTVAAATALAVTGRAQPDWAATLPGLLGYVAFMTCWPIVATAVIALIRNRAASVLLLVLWPLLGERLAQLLFGLVPGLRGFGDALPFAAGRAAMAAGSDTLPEADRALVEGFVGSDLTAASGVSVFIAFTVAMAALGAWSYIKRDAR